MSEPRSFTRYVLNRGRRGFAVPGLLKKSRRQDPFSDLALPYKITKLVLAPQMGGYNT